jgi:hypothetical protein
MISLTENYDHGVPQINFSVHNLLIVPLPVNLNQIK